MVTLDYRTNNPRWGLSGLCFSDWYSYSYTLGYISNEKHYKNLNPYSSNAKIDIRIEGNNEQGAWDKEGRIHYYGNVSDLECDFPDLFDCSSAGTGSIKRRINSNQYIESLLNDYNFELRTYPGYTTAEVVPTNINVIESQLKRHLMNLRLTNSEINDCLNAFSKGFYMS